MKTKSSQRTGKKQGSIRTKIVKNTILIVAIALFVTGLLSVFLNYNSTFNALKKTMAETVELATEHVSSQIKSYQDILYAATLNPTLTDAAADKKDKQAYLESIADAYHFNVIDMTDTNGISLITGEDLSGTDAFSTVKSGSYYISDPVKSSDGTSMYIRLAVPASQNDAFSGMLYGDADASFLSKLLEEINIGDTGNAAILDKEGNTIGFADYQLVLDQYNTQKEAQSDPKLKDLAAIEKAMTEGKTNYGQYYYGGKNKFMSYTPVTNTNGWSMDVSIVRDEFLSGTKTSILITIGITAAAILLSCFLMMRLADNIVNPMQKCVSRLERVVDGDLSSEVPEIHTDDETQVLSETTAVLITSLQAMIKDLIAILQKMGDKNFNVSSSFQYTGDFVPLQTSIGKIIENLNLTFNNIYNVTNQVNTGTGEISKVSQTLSEGAADQAGTIEELTASITDISEKVSKTAEGAQKASALSDKATETAAYNSQQMNKMSDAMEQISSSSEKISQIIKTIDSIASQTNLLSLNASIEAARAGEMGRGFAVVANEIRQLAEQSASAVKDTTDLIEESLHAVENGNATVVETAESLQQIVEVINEVNMEIQSISQDASTQSEAIAQITLALDQISDIVQSNSAIAEESAASSEELNSESNILKDMLDQFQFKQ